MTRRTATATTALLLGLLWGPGEQRAAASTIGADMTVAAAVDMRCSIFTIAVAFGGYSVLTANATTPLDIAGGISLNCDRGRIVRIRLDQGLYPASGSSNAAPLRQMGQGTYRLAYNLYEDAARTTVWNNSPPGVRPPSNSYPIIVPVYGRVPAGQLSPPGSYSDTVVATITF
jgi:spore coat protein U-like protein